MAPRKEDDEDALLFAMEADSITTEGTVDTSFSSNDEEDQDHDSSANRSFQPGDHVYAWCKGKVYQHHGIVLSCAGTSLVIADFTGMIRPGTSAISSSSFNMSSFISLGAKDAPGEMRILMEQDVETTLWKKVKYNAEWKECIMTRAGTVTLSQPDSREMILARVNFLLKNPNLIPPYNVLTSNCETVAFWCTTGRWSTMQVSNALKIAKLLGISSTMGGIAYVCIQTTTTFSIEIVACEGLWGWLGFTTEKIVETTVPLAAMQPFLIPVIAASGSVAMGSTAYRFYKCRKTWKETTKLMNEMFGASSFVVTVETA